MSNANNAVWAILARTDEPQALCLDGPEWIHLVWVRGTHFQVESGTQHPPESFHISFRVVNNSGCDIWVPEEFRSDVKVGRIPY